MAAPALLAPILGGVFKLLDRVIPDPVQRAAAVERLEELRQRGELAELDAGVKLMLAQIEVNRIEASADSWWKSGWRPGAGWAGVAGLVYQYVGQPLLAWVSGLLEVPAPPVLDTSTLVTLLLALLGVGGLRTYEKARGAAAASTSTLALALTNHPAFTPPIVTGNPVSGGR